MIEAGQQAGHGAGSARGKQRHREVGFHRSNISLVSTLHCCSYGPRVAKRSAVLT
jgi:hypothetical protein